MSSIFSDFIHHSDWPVLAICLGWTREDYVMDVDAVAGGARTAVLPLPPSCPLLPQ